MRTFRGYKLDGTLRYFSAMLVKLHTGFIYSIVIAYYDPEILRL